MSLVARLRADVEPGVHRITYSRNEFTAYNTGPMHPSIPLKYQTSVTTLMSKRKGHIQHSTVNISNYRHNVKHLSCPALTVTYSQSQVNSDSAEDLSSIPIMVYIRAIRHRHRNTLYAPNRRRTKLQWQQERTVPSKHDLWMIHGILH